jgi:hypothetical protein
MGLIERVALHKVEFAKMKIVLSKKTARLRQAEAEISSIDKALNNMNEYKISSQKKRVEISARKKLVESNLSEYRKDHLLHSKEVTRRVSFSVAQIKIS